VAMVGQRRSTWDTEPLILVYSRNTQYRYVRTHSASWTPALKRLTPVWGVPQPKEEGSQHSYSS
jgi:hypothetical protein